jgi:hypothetical protein
MLFRGNELNNMFEMNDLGFYNAENELIFACQRAQFGPQKWQKTAFFVSSKPKSRRAGRRWGRAARG